MCGCMAEVLWCQCFAWHFCQVGCGAAAEIRVVYLLAALEHTQAAAAAAAGSSQRLRGCGHVANAR